MLNRVGCQRDGYGHVLLVLAVLLLVGCSGGGLAATPGTTVSLVFSEQDEASATSERAGSEPSIATPSSSAPDVAALCSSSADAQVVRVWEVLGGDVARDAYQKLVEQFNQNQTLVEVESENIEGGSEQLLERLQQTDPSSWPDIVVMQPQALRRLIDSGRIIPPAACASEMRVARTDADLLPSVRAAFSFDGELQAFPFGVSTPVLLYDAAEFRRAGLDPSDPPTSLGDVATASALLVSSGVSPRGLIAYDWYGAFLINQTAAQRGDLVATPVNGRRDGPMRVDFATPTNIAMLNWLTDVIDVDGGVYIGGVPSGLEDLTKIVDPVDGGVMSIHTSGSLGDLIRYLEAGSFPGVELGVGPMPGPAPGGLVGGNGLWLLDHGDAARAGAAFGFATWITAPSQLAEFIALTGYIPPSQAVAAQAAVQSAWDLYPQLRVGFDQLEAMNDSDAAAGPVYGPSIEIDYLFYGATNRVVVDRVDPKQVLTELSNDVNRLLDQYDALAP